MIPEMILGGLLVLLATVILISIPIIIYFLMQGWFIRKKIIAEREGKKGERVHHIKKLDEKEVIEDDKERIKRLEEEIQRARDDIRREERELGIGSGETKRDDGKQESVPIGPNSDVGKDRNRNRKKHRRIKLFKPKPL